MNRTKFTSHGANSCTVEYTDDLDQRVSRTFVARAGFVYEIIGFSGERVQQVCERLSRRGNTLSIGGSQEVIDIIRREFRAMRRSKQRDEACPA